MFLVFLLFACSSEVFLDPPPDIHVPLGAPMVSQTDAFIFILDYSECIVYQYTLRGTLTKKFGGRGQGPGMFTRPYKLTWMNGRLFVHDVHAVHRYDGRGTFLEMKKTPNGLLVERVYGGWVGFEGFYDKNELDLSIFDDDLVEGLPMHTWEVPVSLGDFKETLWLDRDELLVSRDGTWVFAKPRYSGTILCHNIATGASHIIDPKLPPIRLDPAEAERRRITLNRKRARTGLRPIDIPTPDAYPPIKSIMLTHRGNLAISRWYSPSLEMASAREATERGLLVITDRDGNRIEPQVTERFPVLVISETEGWLIHLAYDASRERTTLRRVPVAQAEASLEKAWKTQTCVSCVP